jgi:hypothetical protein
MASVGLLIVAANLSPASQGYGTHTQMPRMQPCATLAATGFPCPTCGMTTAFAHAADGNLLASFAAQPAGAVLAILTAMFVLVSSYAMIVGLPPATILRPFWTPRLLLWMGGLVIAAWIYKIMSIHGVF